MPIPPIGPVRSTPVAANSPGKRPKKRANGTGITLAWAGVRIALPRRISRVYKSIMLVAAGIVLTVTAVWQVAQISESALGMAREMRAQTREDVERWTKDLEAAREREVDLARRLAGSEATLSERGIEISKLADELRTTRAELDIVTTRLA